jgi:hypothetical protein
VTPTGRRLALAICVLMVGSAAGCRSMLEASLESRIRGMLAREWIEAETEDLTVFSGLDLEATRQLTAELVAFRGVVGKLAPAVRTRGSLRTHVYLLPPSLYPGSSAVPVASARELERVRHSALNAERAWIPRERVANTWPAERLAAWAERGGDSSDR